MTAKRVIRDPVHGYVEVPGALEVLIEHPYIQRLRRLSQTSMSSAVYPSMNGRRFEHSLGTMHLAGLAWDVIVESTCEPDMRRFQDSIRIEVLRIGGDAALDDWITDDVKYRLEFPTHIRNAVCAAALLHDIGHSPYSHALEKFFLNKRRIFTPQNSDFNSFRSRVTREDPDIGFHEVCGLYMLDQIDDSNFTLVSRTLVRAILQASPRGKSALGALKSILSGDVDVDRIDYLKRDSLYAGTPEHGSFDHARMIGSIVLRETSDDEWVLGFLLRARSALESFVRQRYEYYRWIAYHPHVVAENRILDRAAYELESVLGTTPVFEYNFCYYWSGQAVIGNQNSLGDRFPHDTTITDAASVDDQTIDVAMKDLLGFVERKRVQGNHLSALEKRFTTLAKAHLFRVPNWTAIWRTESQFREFCEDIEDDIRAMLTRLSGEATENQTTSQQNVDSVEAMAWDDAIATVMDLVNEETATALVNRTVEAVLASDGGASRPHELHLSEVLTEHTDFSALTDGLDDSFWILAFDSIVAWKRGSKDNPDHTIRMFDGEDETSLQKEDPNSVMFYDEREDERNKLNIFAVCTGRERLREGKVLTHATRYRQVLLKALPTALEEVLRLMWVLPTQSEGAV